MTLLEALKHSSVENLDTEDILVDICWERGEEDQLKYDLLIKNLTYCLEPEDVEKLMALEVNEQILNDIRERKTYERWDIADDFMSAWLIAAYLASTDTYYKDVEDDEWEDFWEDEATWELTLSDFGFKCTFLQDIDLT